MIKISKDKRFCSSCRFFISKNEFKNDEAICSFCRHRKEKHDDKKEPTNGCLICYFQLVAKQDKILNHLKLGGDYNV